MWLELIIFVGVTLLLRRLLSPSSQKKFWEKYGIPQVPDSSLMDKIQVFRGEKSLTYMDEVAYQTLRSTGGKYIGTMEMGIPFLVIKDLDLAKKIMIKDFDYFLDRRQLFSNEKQKIMTRVLVNLDGDEWKGVRAAMSPTFTTGKIRRMMSHFNLIGLEWVEHIKARIIRNGRGDPLPINIHMEVNSFAVDAIAAAGFGMNAGAISNPESRFGRMAKQLNDFTGLVAMKFALAINFPRLMKFLGIPLFDVESLSFFENLLTQVLKDRLQGIGGNRNDFIQLLVEARKGELISKGNDELSHFEKDAQLSGGALKVKKNYLADDETAIAQAFIFFVGGFSTTSNFIAFVLYVLAVYPEVQEKLRKEVDSKLFSKGDDDKNVDYDELNGLVYMDMVVCEVLRKFPAANRLERKCVKDYYDPAEDLRVPKGAIVSVPIDCIHNDKEFYEFPDKFYPEHFTPEAKAKRHPYAFMPFGSGPRNCIGMRFALVESKAAIAHLVHSFKIEATARTPVPVQARNAGIGVQIPDNLELGFRLL